MAKISSKKKTKRQIFRKRPKTVRDRQMNVMTQRDAVGRINRGGQSYPDGHLAGSRAAVHSTYSELISVTSSHDL